MVDTCQAATLFNQVHLSVTFSELVSSLYYRKYVVASQNFSFAMCFRVIMLISIISLWLMPGTCS